MGGPRTIGDPRTAKRGAATLAALVVVVGLAAGACGSLTGPDVITLFVGPRKVDCVGVGPRTCLQTRESPSEEWTLFYDAIEGFEFEPGFVYELRVAVYEVDPVAADGSSRRYVLREIVSKTPA